MTASITLLEKARRGRRAALAALAVARMYDEDDSVVSIFDDAFEALPLEVDFTGSNVIPFRLTTAGTPRPAMLLAA